MRSPWARRTAETFAVLVWKAGPEGSRRIARFFAENPNLMRLLGAGQLAFGLWLALRQFREG